MEAPGNGLLRCSNVFLMSTKAVSSYRLFKSIAVIAVEPAGKAAFVYRSMQTRLMGQYNGK